jgi:hypothetical protein
MRRTWIDESASAAAFDVDLQTGLVCHVGLEGFVRRQSAENWLRSKGKRSPQRLGRSELDGTTRSLVESRLYWQPENGNACALTLTQAEMARDPGNRSALG